MAPIHPRSRAVATKNRQTIARLISFLLADKRPACCVAVPPHSFEVVDACRGVYPHDGISRAVFLGCYFGRK